MLVGDFLYSRAFQMMVDIGRMPVMQILANATNTIAAGEVMQLMNIHDPDVTEESYRQVIYRKTAKLFEAGAQIAALLADRDTNDQDAMIAYGRHLGCAFQLVDDALDYDASPNELGKNLGDDLAEGKPTLPLIYAMENGSAAEKRLIQNAIQADGIDKLDLSALNLSFVELSISGTTDTLITYNDGVAINSITLEGVDSANIDASDFIF